MRTSVCIYIRNQLMVDLMQEFLPIKPKNLGGNPAIVVHKYAWTTNEYVIFYLATKNCQRHLGRPPIKYYQSYGIAIIDSGVKLRKLMLLIELGLTPEEISCTLRGV